MSLETVLSLEYKALLPDQTCLWFHFSANICNNLHQVHTAFLHLAPKNYSTFLNVFLGGY